MAALWEKTDTVQGFLDNYLRKGNPRSKKCVYPVHRLDQATSGILLFAKTEEAQMFLKENWPATEKTYYAIAHGKFKNKSGLIESYLKEDEDYVVHSSKKSDEGKLAKTEYKVVHETEKLSVVKVNLITGKKNQIRVHLAELGNPIVGDAKYGNAHTPFKNLMLHSFSIVITHPFKKEKVRFQVDVPKYFKSLVDYKY